MPAHRRRLAAAAQERHASFEAGPDRRTDRRNPGPAGRPSPPPGGPPGKKRNPPPIANTPRLPPRRTRRRAMIARTSRAFSRMPARNPQPAGPDRQPFPGSRIPASQTAAFKVPRTEDEQKTCRCPAAACGQDRQEGIPAQLKQQFMLAAKPAESNNSRTGKQGRSALHRRNGEEFRGPAAPPFAKMRRRSPSRAACAATLPPSAFRGGNRRFPLLPREGRDPSPPLSPLPARTAQAQRGRRSRTRCNRGSKPV